ncbi:hypothetical protein P175DRAFT_0496990 [Aspergillus ochraceoroseus IBT 24754]|uniref:Ureidoglycolate hydrolase n=2 Tax=Aspergillus ochraceoroseus TaxID=138278 RepID=A0A2T5M5R0_9EURO|nr:uncharacterized protein P175DRAFT_0496990 [Aspergillus ochraceoroseus IBT 24754]KKK22004.1 hypothetical protein AOCH_003867 [Aspergillus ochraceoroseus]PTU23864.1 hypothetical protein P175DRAFT_0496990 [Aspergillus ochraceoroseus IBT 24754]
MPPPTLQTTPDLLVLAPEPLTRESFAPFGTAIIPPLPRNTTTPPTPLSTHPTQNLVPRPALANQGSALKYSPISPVTNQYPGQCPSGKASEARMTMFSCFPRSLRLVSDRAAGGGGKVAEKGVFDVRILERHPFTTQTFIPLDLSSRFRTSTSTSTSTSTCTGTGTGTGTGTSISTATRIAREKEENTERGEEEEEEEEEEEAHYLVVVAPTLKGQTALAASDSGAKVSIRDPPDLGRARAFLACGGQAVTYAAGTWHAPMVVLGRRRVDFVVVQFVNGVDGEDCQEVRFGEGLVVDCGVEGARSGSRSGAKL